MDIDSPRVVLVTGVQAAGKSTIGRLLAGRFAGHRHASSRATSCGRWSSAVDADMADPPSDEAHRQLLLRYEHGAMLARLLARGIRRRARRQHVRQ